MPCLQAELQQATEEEDLTADEVLLRRMDAGLYTLQQCALIIGNLWIVGDQLVKQRILMLLHQQVGRAVTAGNNAIGESCYKYHADASAGRGHSQLATTQLVKADIYVSCCCISR